MKKSIYCGLVLISILGIVISILEVHIHTIRNRKETFKNETSGRLSVQAYTKENSSVIFSGNTYRQVSKDLEDNLVRLWINGYKTHIKTSITKDFVIQSLQNGNSIILKSRYTGTDRYQLCKLTRYDEEFDMAYGINVYQETVPISLDMLFNAIPHYVGIVIYPEREQIINTFSAEDTALMLDVLHIDTLPKYIDAYSDDVLYYPWQWYAMYIQTVFKNDKNTQLISYTQYMDYIQEWYDLIPERFIFAMVNMSLIYDVPLAYIYSIARLESLNFNFFESLKRNANGTVDFGIMGLNNGNFDTTTKYGKQFLATFYYNDGTTIPFDYMNQLHILKICVGYYKSLYTVTKSYYTACIAYNGGLARVLQNEPRTAAVQYAEVVAAIRYTVQDRIQPTTRKGTMDPFVQCMVYSSIEMQTYVATATISKVYISKGYVIPTSSDIDWISQNEYHLFAHYIYMNKRDYLYKEELQEAQEKLPYIGKFNETFKYVVLGAA